MMIMMMVMIMMMMVMVHQSFFTFGLLGQLEPDDNLQTKSGVLIRVTIVAILQNFKVINCCQILKDLKVKLMKTWR